MQPTGARCPGCGSEGTLGEPCAEKGCRARGYRFIPADYWTGKPDALAGVMIGEYLVVDRLGEGGFGKVYLALQMPIGMKAALKVMHLHNVNPDMAESLARRFEGEAAALARLSHPNIVRLLKYGMHEETPYLVMEFVEGGRTLKGEIRDRARRKEAIPLDMTRDVVRQILNALEAAHERAIVHRDVKPENVMLQTVAGNPNLVKVLDFGLAKFVREDTETSLLAGTPVYMAPEQLQRTNIGPWTDLYALGALAFEMMTGRRAFAGETPDQVLASKLDPSYDPLARVADLGLSPAAAAFLRRALAVRPEDRYRAAAEFREAMEPVFAEAGPPAPASRDMHELADTGEVRRLEQQRERLEEERRRVEAEQALVREQRAALRAQRYEVAAEVAAGQSAGAAGPGGGPGHRPGAWTPPVKQEGAGDVTLWQRVQRRSSSVLWLALGALALAAALVVVFRAAGGLDAVGWLRGVFRGDSSVATVAQPRPSTAGATPMGAPVEAVVSSEPPGATARTMQGLDLGRTPVTILVPPGGSVDVRLALPGYREEQVSLAHETVRANPEVKVTLKRR